MRRVFLTIVPLVALFCLMLSGSPALADSPFTVSGIKVEGSAASVSEARNAAIAAGREKAWQVLFRRLTQPHDWPRQPVLGAVPLQRLIASYYPSGEKRSTTRYVADVTYIFNRKSVVKLLQDAGIAFAAHSAERVLVLPVGSASAALMSALSNPRYANVLVPFDLPTAESQEAGALPGLSFAASGWSDVSALAARHGVNTVVLLSVASAGNDLAVSVRWLNSSGTVRSETAGVPPVHDSEAGYVAAADLAVQMMGNLWKTHAALDTSRKGELVVEVQVSSLSGLAALRQALVGIPNIADTSVDAIDIGAARLTVAYLGSVAQLRNALARAGMTLAENGGSWQLSVRAPVAEAP